MLVCDETPFSCLQDQGRGKLPASDAEAKGKTNYIVALTTADHVPKPITLYYYSPTRSAENIDRILEDYDFETLVTDGYSGYRTILKNRNQDKPILECSSPILFSSSAAGDPEGRSALGSLQETSRFLMQQHEKDTEGMKLHAAFKSNQLDLLI